MEASPVPPSLRHPPSSQGQLPPSPALRDGCQGLRTSCPSPCTASSHSGPYSCPIWLHLQPHSLAALPNRLQIMKFSKLLPLPLCPPSPERPLPTHPYLPLVPPRRSEALSSPLAEFKASPSLDSRRDGTAPSPATMGLALTHRWLIGPHHHCIRPTPRRCGRRVSLLFQASARGAQTWRRPQTHGVHQSRGTAGKAGARALLPLPHPALRTLLQLLATLSSVTHLSLYLA